MYLTTARKLGVAPERCMAIEDSPNGVLAARSAGMACLAFPQEPSAAGGVPGADLVLDSLVQVGDWVWNAMGLEPGEPSPED